MPADFSKSRSEAVRLLLSSRLYGIKIDVTKLKYGKSIIFDSFSNFCLNSCATFYELESCGGLQDGCTIRRKATDSVIYIVLYNDKVKSKTRRRFTLAHEIGHIILEHETDDDTQESEANLFAAELILPRILVWELQKRTKFKITANEVAEIFGVSNAASRVQIRSLEREHDFSDDEKLLLDKMKNFLPDPDGPIIDC